MTNPEQQILIDKMVDGELSAPEQRQLLQSCEQEESWRALALAYVESQTWREELPAWLGSPPTPAPLASQAPPAGGRDFNPWALALAICLSLFAGYGLGWAWPDPITVGPTSEVADGRRVDPQDAPARAEGLSSIPLMVADPGGNGLREVELPVLRASDLAPDWMDRMGSRVPEETLRELRGQGIDVSQMRWYAPVDYQGKQVVIPIDVFFERDFQ